MAETDSLPAMGEKCGLALQKAEIVSGEMLVTQVLM